MAPTFRSGDRLLVFAPPGGLGRLLRPGRFAVVVCADPTDGRRECVKRVVGLPGETVALARGRLLVNGAPVAEPPATRDGTRGGAGGGADEAGGGADFGPVRVPDGAYFLLGDNREESIDSRVWATESPPVWVTRREIAGRVLGRVRPW